MLHRGVAEGEDATEGGEQVMKARLKKFKTDGFTIGIVFGLSAWAMYDWFTGHPLWAAADFACVAIMIAFWSMDGEP